MFEVDKNDSDESEDEELNLPCNYEGCDESFGSHQDRLAHSMREHWDNLDPKDYPKMTGEEHSLSFKA